MQNGGGGGVYAAICKYLSQGLLFVIKACSSLYEHDERV